MGITVRDLLSVEYFKNFTVVAGKNGLNREIQGVTVADAPDGYRWKTEKELCFTSGYVFAQEPDFITGLFQGHSRLSALIIKQGRYFDEFPDYVIQLCNDHDVPLISMPYGIPWMEAINQVYTAVINHAIQLYGVSTPDTPYRPQSANYKEQKIRRILRAVESDMEFPAMLYDLFEEKSYYSSANFPKYMEEFQIQDSDCWEPTEPHSRYTMCDSIHMTRFRLKRGEAQGQPRISWVTIPIMVAGAPQAYFCVMESRRFLDFCDEYSMRIAYLALLSVYEQIVALRDSYNIGFEQLLHLAMDLDEENIHRLHYQASHQGLSLDDTYIYVMFRHDHKNFDIRTKRNAVMDLFLYCGMEPKGRLAFLSKDEGIILFRSLGATSGEISRIQNTLTEFNNRMSQKFEGMKWTFAVHYESKRLQDIRSCVNGYRKMLKVGKVAFPNQTILDYRQLGILTWLDIPDDELKKLLEDFKVIMEADKNRELLRTLKVYLENNMNYSLTAEKLFVNINTIRRRIEKVNEMVDMDWDSYYTRTKIGLMLQFMQL